VPAPSAGPKAALPDEPLAFGRTRKSGTPGDQKPPNEDE